MRPLTARKLPSWTAAATLFAAAATTVPAPGAWARQAAEVELRASEVAVYADTVADFEAMSVRIADPDGNLVLGVRSYGEPVAWGPTAGDPDGLYRYEVVVITLDPEAGSEEDDTGERLSWRTGSFEIRSGAIVGPGARESSLWDGALRLAGVALDAIGEAIVPTARAQDLTASSDRPAVEFEDTSSGAADRAAEIDANIPDSSDDFRFSFLLHGPIASNEVIDIDTGLSGDQSLTIDLDGDIGLAGGSVFIDRQDGFVGIGTTTPEAQLHLSGTDFPTIRLEDNGVSPRTWLVQSVGDDFLVNDNTAGTIPFRVKDDASSNTLVVDRGVRVGIGTESPAATLEVTTSDGTTQILVEETAAIVENRTLVQLTNNGRPRIRLSNRDSGVNWVTGMGPDDAYIIRRGSNEYRFSKGGQVRWFLAGVAEPIFDFDNDGSLTLAGTLTESSDVNAKRDIAPLGGPALLDRVAALPVATWSYTADASGARHVGPMAQDFHAAFGLGADDTSISPRDLAGVALAAVQELLRQKDAEIASLRAQQPVLRARNEVLRQRLDALEARLAR